MGNGLRGMCLPDRREEAHTCSVLKVEQVREIRRHLAAGLLSAPKIALLFGVSAAAVYNIKYGRTWKSLPIEALRAARNVPCRGEEKPAAKLTPALVRSMRAALSSGEPVLHVSRRYGISRPQVRAIRDGKAWRHVQ